MSLSVKSDATVEAGSSIVIRSWHVRYVSERPAISLCAVTTLHLARNDNYMRSLASIIGKTPLRRNAGYLSSDSHNNHVYVIESQPVIIDGCRGYDGD
jgi:hypothetical protein